MNSRSSDNDIHFLLSLCSGYRIVGSHSGVKLCRWTKSMLRGRGGCYKHTFYGIESHRCMETTPSLACANKCVFCWRLVCVCCVHIKVCMRLEVSPHLSPPSLSVSLPSSDTTPIPWVQNGVGRWMILR